MGQHVHVIDEFILLIIFILFSLKAYIISFRINYYSSAMAAPSGDSHVAKCLKDLPQRLQTASLNARKEIFQVEIFGKSSFAQTYIFRT